MAGRVSKSQKKLVIQWIPLDQPVATQLKIFETCHNPDGIRVQPPSGHNLIWFIHMIVQKTAAVLLSRYCTNACA